MAPPALPPREVTVLLCDRTGELIGTLPSFEVTVPWWQEVGDVVAGCRDRYAVEVAVLRVLPAGADENAAGGPVTYLAEVVAGVPAVTPTAWHRPAPPADHPLRLPYARPGGPAGEVAWADARLLEAGRARTGRAVQVRTWNLSSIWRLPTDGGTTWLKSVPPFFAHAGEM